MNANLQAIISTLQEWSGLRAAAKKWDDQIKADSEAGLLDDLKQEALEDHRQGRDTEL